MSHEIVWTAAARTHLAKEDGRGGTEGAGYGTGYGNVVLTRGMPPNLTRLLENLQAYRELPAAPREQQQSKPSPVEFLHFVGRYGGELLHVLGRRARAPSAGGRTNHIVHLVALQSTDFDQVPFEDSAGPAAEVEVLDQKLRWNKSWPYDAKPVFREQSQSPRPTLQASRCRLSFNRWMEHTGDAGWAGVLIDAFAAGQTIALIVPRDRDWSEILVKLYDEALQLLPANQRWQVGFSTYWTGAMPTGLKCHWRGMYADTEEAAIHRRNPRVITIDLCTPERPRLTQSSHWIEKARDHARLQSLPSPPRERRSADSSDSPVEVGSKPEHADDQAPNTTETETCKLSLPESQPAPHERQVELSPRQSGRRWSIKNYWLWLGAGALALSLVAVVVVTFSETLFPVSETSQQLRESENPSGEDPAADQSLGSTRPKNPSQKQPTAPELADVHQPEPAPTKNAKPTESLLLDPLPLASSAPTQATVLEPQPVPVAKPFDDIRNRNCRLPLPSRPKPTQQLGVTESPKPAELANLNVDNPDQLQLAVLGDHHWLESIKEFVPVRLAGEKDGWEIFVKNTKTKFQDKIGEFRCESGKLLFQFASSKSLSDEPAFAHCWIGLSYHGSSQPDKVAFALRPITKISSAPLKLVGFSHGSTEVVTVELPDVPKSAQEKLTAKLYASLVPSSELQSRLPKPFRPSPMRNREPVDFDFRNDKIRLPLTLTWELNARDLRKSKITAVRSMFLNFVDETSGTVTPETRTYDPTTKDQQNESLFLSSQFEDETRQMIDSLKKSQAELRKTLQSEKANKAPQEQINETNARLMRFAKVMDACEANIRFVKEYEQAFQQLQKLGDIDIQFHWDATDDLKKWPPAPESAPPLDVLWSTSGN